jgi:predicted lipoprotein with Yx(FWY)xxD motif
MKTILMCGAGALLAALLFTPAAHAADTLTDKKGMTLYTLLQIRADTILN